MYFAYCKPSKYFAFIALLNIMAVKVPERYLKLKDSIRTAADLEKMNALRRHEIKSSNEVAIRLEHDLNTEKERLRAIQAKKDAILEQLAKEGETTHSCGTEGKNGSSGTSTTHRLLSAGDNHLSQKRDSSSSPTPAIVPSDTVDVNQTMLKRHPDESIMRWLVRGDD